MALKDTYINYIELSNGDKYPIGGHHKTGSWNGLTYTAGVVGSNTSELKFTIPTGTTATTVAAGNHTHANYVSYDSVKTLKTDNTTAQTASSETITGSGTINLHKISKTGDYNDLLNKPNVSESLVEKTYSELKTLRDNSQLVPGTWYRITDYSCTTTQSSTSSAGHQFDIIVKADAINKLNENAYAAHHAGDTYFANSKLEAWQLWYCLDNDTNRFEWANSTTGKGVIYRMIDEFNNDIPYDFKNILFTTSGKYTNAYTFSYTENSTIKDASLLGWSKLCYNNVIGTYINNSTGRQPLNFNIFYSTNGTFSCYSNIFANDCYSNTFGDNCYSNTFGNSCYSNTFASGCHSNIFGNNCYSNRFQSTCLNNIFWNSCRSNTFQYMCSHNTFGNYCYNNTFGGNCTYNTFGSYCQSNVFGSACNNNTLGSNCYHNTFGSYCSYNTSGNYFFYNNLGNSCESNTFGNYCYSNTFGDSSSTINYCKHIIIDNGCQYLYINSTDTSASSSNYLQNIHIHLGVKGTSSSRTTITIPDRNLQYESNVYLDESGNIKIVINEGEDGVTSIYAYPEDYNFLTPYDPMKGEVHFNDTFIKWPNENYISYSPFYKFLAYNNSLDFYDSYVKSTFSRLTGQENTYIWIGYEDSYGFRANTFLITDYKQEGSSPSHPNIEIYTFYSTGICDENFIQWTGFSNVPTGPVQLELVISYDTTQDEYTITSYTFTSLGGGGSSYTAGIGISIASNTISNTGVAYSTTAPSSANTSGDLKFVVLDSEPATRYDGYLYIITEPAVTLISFEINNTTYQAEKGMTWAEWCDSEYNTAGFRISNNSVITGIQGMPPVSGVVATDTITNGGQYSMAGGVDN